MKKYVLLHKTRQVFVPLFLVNFHERKTYYYTIRCSLTFLLVSPKQPIYQLIEDDIWNQQVKFHRITHLSGRHETQNLAHFFQKQKFLSVYSSFNFVSLYNMTAFHLTQTILIICVIFCLTAVLLLSVVTWQAIAAPSTNPSDPVNYDFFSTNVFKVNINSLYPFPVSVAFVPVGNILSSFSSCSFRSFSFSCTFSLSFSSYISWYSCSFCCSSSTSSSNFVSSPSSYSSYRSYFAPPPLYRKY